MDDARTSRAIERIEAALARIERAAKERPNNSAADHDLANRHDALKASVSSSLAQLDQLIGKLEQ